MTDRQQLIVKNVDAYKQQIAEAERWIWEHPQTGFTEWEAHGYLAEKFQEMGYELVMAGNIPGFYTDVETGKPGPKLCIMGELDALDIAGHPESVNGMTHCCGHHAQCAAMLGIAGALKEPGALDGLCGTIQQQVRVSRTISDAVSETMAVWQKQSASKANLHTQAELRILV